MEKTYTVSDLRNLVLESSNEFKAKLGAGVESGNKENNGKAYADAKKRAKDFDGGLQDEVGSKHPKYDKTYDDNMTMLDVLNAGNVGKDFKDKVKAQMQGYTSVAEKNNGIEKSADYSDGENIYNGIKDKGQEIHKAKKDLAKSGLQAREWPDKVFTDDKNELYESKIKTAHFKKTEFLSEDHMKSRIPDEFKNEGSKFIMKDKNDNKYLCEWSDNKCFILEHSNKHGFNEAMDKMRHLFNYNADTYYNTRDSKLNEGNDVHNTLDIIRELKNGE